MARSLSSTRKRKAAKVRSADTKLKRELETEQEGFKRWLSGMEADPVSSLFGLDRTEQPRGLMSGIAMKMTGVAAEIDRIIRLRTAGDITDREFILLVKAMP